MDSNNLIARVAVPVPLNKLYDYKIDTNKIISPKEIKAGSRVLIEFGPRRCIGIISEVLPQSKSDQQELKTIVDIDQTNNGFGPTLFELIKWAAQYYCHPLGDCFSAALPSLLRHKITPPDLRTRLWHRTKTEFQGRANAHKQREILEFIAQHPTGAPVDLLRKKGYSNKQLIQLEENNYLFSQQVDELEENKKADESIVAPKTLNKEQQQAVRDIQSYHLNAEKKLSVCLLEGITGSGKTEVYIELVKEVISHGGQALILIPEINLSPQTFERFQNNLPTSVAVIHSGISEKQHYINWRRALTGQAKVVIGTRSAIFTQFESLSLIIVDEEHDSSFKQTEGFKYSARDLAVKRAQLEGCQVVLGSATPSLETIYKAQSKQYAWMKLTQRAASNALPKISLIDIKSRPLEHGCSRPLISAIEQELNEGNQVILFQNRRGFAPTLMCKSCGALVECDHCDSRMTLHSDPSHLRCHHCEHKRPVPKQCHACGSSDLSAVGVGTERIEYGIRDLFPDTRIIRVDRDSTRNTREMARHIEFLRSSEPAILIGTQMLAKGHDFPNVTLVGVIDADGLFFSSDFRAIEKGAQLLTQISGRAGRGAKTGKVLIQTRLPEHPLFHYLIQHNYLDCALEELEEREHCALPPQAKMISVRAESKQQELTISTLTKMRTAIGEQLKEAGFKQDDIQFAGPFAAAITRKKGSFRAYLTLTSANPAARHHSQKLLPELVTNLSLRSCRLQVDVDPSEYL